MKIPYFVSYNDHGEMIVMRYYPLSLFNSKKHSIEIPKPQFVKYELKPFFFGRHQKIILYQHFRNKVVAYPPISLSAAGRRGQKQDPGLPSKVHQELSFNQEHYQFQNFHGRHR